MPEPVIVRATARSSTVSAPAARAVRARAELLAALPRPTEPGPATATTCYVWPTDYCDVGCAHCNFASPRPPHVRHRFEVADNLDRVLRLVNGMGLWKAVLSGGGEPMMKPAFCQGFIRQVDSPNLAEVELITSGSFAVSITRTRQEIAALAAAWRARGAHRADVTFTIRVSLDWFHARRIGIEPAANILRVLGEPAFEDIGVYLRSVLLDDDRTVSDLACILDATLSPVHDYQQSLSLPDGRDIVVYYKNLILDGRMTRGRLDSLPVRLPEASRAAVFGDRFKNDAGRHVPARVYNGPTVVHLDGLATIVEASGGIKILEGNHPDRYPRLPETSDWADAVSLLYADPITVALVHGGPDLLVQLIANEYPQMADVTSATNQLYYLAEKILADPVVSLFATVRSVEFAVDAGILPASALDAALSARHEWESVR